MYLDANFIFIHFFILNYLILKGVLEACDSVDETQSNVITSVPVHCTVHCTIASKINGTPKGIYLPISKLHLILAVANLLAHNNISQFVTGD